MKNTDHIDQMAIYQDVRQLLGHDTSGHGMDHVDRVLRLARIFAQAEGADMEIVELAALLHDVDDYKIFGRVHAQNLLNANRILEHHAIAEQTKRRVLTIIQSMGYNNYISGIRPDTIEGMVVSDADMCDGIGAMGILRTHAYALSKANAFFDDSMHPEAGPVDAAEYRATKKSHSVQHFFDKLLKIPSIVMTESGRKEAKQRTIIMSQFLRQLFHEEDSRIWQDYLQEFENSLI